jgi:hypothetical protein
MKKVYGSLLAGVVLSLFAMATQAAPLHTFNWTGQLSIIGFGPPPLFQQNGDSDVFTTIMTWEIDNGSTMTIGTPSGASTQTSGSFQLEGVPANLQVLPVTIITEIADFLISAGITGTVNIGPGLPGSDTSGPSLVTLPIVDATANLNTQLDFTRIITGPNSLIYEVTETPNSALESLAGKFFLLDGSSCTPACPDGRISTRFTLDATVAEVPTPPIFWLMTLGLLGIYHQRRKA